MEILKLTFFIPLKVEAINLIFWSGGMENYRGCSPNNCPSIFPPLSAQSPHIFNLKDQKAGTFFPHPNAKVFNVNAFRFNQPAQIRYWDIGV